jgi:hypothetical protein
MALPPGWIVIYEAALHFGLDIKRDEAMQIEQRLKKHGWEIVPNYAVDESKIFTKIIEDR